MQTDCVLSAKIKLLREDELAVTEKQQIRQDCGYVK